ncbi:hypothetical protein COHA_009083 [Chlorella ohadii]|uniref:Uncharacterized protein n=1 Tax=Chlorella ohadii TaxID=2649997 RepID=A0AAD5DFI0_9CHLO|nr:hypothetical protein COHA_009083 [Chlorella ohadii]
MHSARAANAVPTAAHLRRQGAAMRVVQVHASPDEVQQLRDIFAGLMSGLIDQQTLRTIGMAATGNFLGSAANEVFKLWLQAQQVEQQDDQQLINELQGQLRALQGRCNTAEGKLGAAQEMVGRLKEQLRSHKQRIEEQTRRADEAEAALAALKAAQSPKTGD